MTQTSGTRYHAQAIINLFNGLFSENYATVLVRGEDEPLYRPASESSSYHEIIFANGYFSSALHEIAHWCIAGPARRKRLDFGYWYQPDGRSAVQQRTFEQVEVKPQALEWIFSISANYPFRFSADNLEGVTTDMGPFRARVHNQVADYLAMGLPKRARLLSQALANTYERALPLEISLFDLAEVPL